MRNSASRQGSRTSCYDHAGGGVVPPNPSEETTRFSVGLIGYGARIHDAHLSVAPRLHHRRAAGFHFLAHALGVVLVGFTPKRLEKNPHAVRLAQLPPIRVVIVRRRKLSSKFPEVRFPASIATSTAANGRSKA